MERNANHTSSGHIHGCRRTNSTPYAEQTSGNGNSTDARLADYSTATRWHRRYIIHRYASRRSSSRNGKLDAYSRRSENRPEKGGVRITRSRRSGMHSMLRQLWSALTPKALYSRYQQHGWNAGYRKAMERCRSVLKRRNRWTGRMPFRAGRRNGLTKRSGRLLFCAEVPERVDQKVRETAVPYRSAGTG